MLILMKKLIALVLTLAPLLSLTACGGNSSDSGSSDAAVAFLNWFAMSDEGKKLVSETCAMISPFKSNDVPCANDSWKNSSFVRLAPDKK